MSKLRVRTLFGDQARVVELSRGDSANYNSLRDAVTHQHDLHSFQIKYLSPAMGEVVVSDPESLHKVIKDAELRQVLAIELRVSSQEKQAPVARASAPYSSTSTPKSPTPASPAYSSYTPSPSHPSPSHPSPSYHSVTSPSSHSGSGGVTGVIHTFTLAGDANSQNPDKVSVKANQEDDHFLFVPQPAKYPSEVTVELEGSKLSFQSTTRHPDGRIFQFKQGFALPFSTIPANTIDIQGNNIRISF